MSDKNNINNLILDLIDDLCPEGDEDQNGAVLFLHLDKESSIVTLKKSGDIKNLSAAFLNQLDNNEKFRRFVAACYGTYTFHHPEEKDMFLKGLDQRKISSALCLWRKLHIGRFYNYLQRIGIYFRSGLKARNYQLRTHLVFIFLVCWQS